MYICSMNTINVNELIPRLPFHVIYYSPYIIYNNTVWGIIILGDSELLTYLSCCTYMYIWIRHRLSDRTSYCGA
jgi:hypothetical protein